MNLCTAIKLPEAAPLNPDAGLFVFHGRNLADGVSEARQ